jgi:hypothetical protein
MAATIDGREKSMKCSESAPTFVTSQGFTLPGGSVTWWDTSPTRLAAISSAA